MWIPYNPNPVKRDTGDCVIRAICRVTGMSWNDVYWDLCDFGGKLKAWGDSDIVWGTYLASLGFARYTAPNLCPLCEELIPFADQQKWSDTDLERIDRMTHAIKSIDTILAMEEDKEDMYNGARYGRRYRDSRDEEYDTYRNSSAIRPRDRIGRYKLGGRSRGGEMDDVMSQLETAMRNSSDTNTRQDIQRIMQRLENA